MRLRTPQITAVAALVLLSGCSSTGLSPREAFLTKVPNERANYVQLYEVSVDALREREDKLLSVTKAIVRGIRESEGQANSPAVEERLNRIDTTAEALHNSALNKLADLERLYNPRRDCILYFHYKAGTQDESGLLVTRGGKVKNRLVFGENWK